MWTMTLGVAPDAPVAAYALTRVVVVGDTVVVFGLEPKPKSGFFSGQVAVHVVLALDLASGAPRWRTVLYEDSDAAGPGTLLVDGQIVVVSNAVITAAMSLADGRGLWLEKNPVIPAMQIHSAMAYGVALAVVGNAVQADAVGFK